MHSLEAIPLEDLLAELRRRREAIEAAELEAGLRQEWQRLTRSVAEAFGLPPAALWRPGRQEKTTQARQAAMVMMREHLGMTLEAIGEVFGKDHGTVIHALQTHESRLTQPRYRVAYQAATAAVA